MKIYILLSFWAFSSVYAYDYSDLHLSAGETKCFEQPELEEVVINYNQQKVIHGMRSVIFAETAQDFSRLQTKAKRLAITSTSLMIFGGVGIAAIGSSIKVGGLAIFKGAQFVFPTSTFLKAAPLVVLSDIAKVYVVVRYSANGAIVGMKLFNRLSEEQVAHFREMKGEVYAIDKTQILNNLKEFDARIKNYKKLLYTQIDELEKQKLEDSLKMRMKTLGWSTYANIKVDRMVSEKLAEIHSEISDVYKILQGQLENLCSGDAV
jgi:hypothetical protein